MKCRSRWAGCTKVARPGRRSCPTCAEQDAAGQRERRRRAAAGLPPPPPASHTRLRSPVLVARRLEELALDADAAGLRGSGARLRGLAAELRGDPTVERAAAVAREVAAAVSHAMACLEDEDSEVDVLVAAEALALWERAREAAA